MKLTMMRGLPGSGKTTLAKQWQKEDKNLVRVNKDELRKMLHDSVWSRENEQDVLKVRDSIIAGALMHKKSVVVDDTGFAPKHEKHLQQIADQFKIEFVVHFVDTPIEECIERDKNRPYSVGAIVILDMYERYLKVGPPTPPQNESLPKAIICDIDGTLAHMTDRGPFEWNKVGSDKLDHSVARLVQMFSGGYEVLIVSGRDGSCEPATLAWLMDHGVPFKELHMRKAGDMRKDYIVKEEILRDLQKRYYIEFVLDDRDQVVRMWRRNGLKCLQVASGAF